LKIGLTYRNVQILHSVFGSEQHYFSFVLIQFKHVRTHP
jgi:hypothetical protein